MSIVNRSLIVPENTRIIIKEKEKLVEIVGAEKNLVCKIPSQVIVVKEGNKLFTRAVENIKRRSSLRKARALAGTLNSLIHNAIIGVSSGHTKPLVIRGVGYKALLKNKELEFSLGFSYSPSLSIPDDLEVSCPGNTQIIVKGVDKDKVGKFASKIRSLRKPNPYKPKGIYYKDEEVRLKPGKTLNK